MLNSKSLNNWVTIFPRCYNATNNPLREIREADVAVRQPKRRSKDEYQTDRFIILLLVLQISMFMVSFVIVLSVYGMRPFKFLLRSSHMSVLHDFAILETSYHKISKPHLLFCIHILFSFVLYRVKLYKNYWFPCVNNKKFGLKLIKISLKEILWEAFLSGLN